MCSLDGPDKSDSFPHVNISVQSARVRQLFFGSRNTKDGLQVPRLPEDPSLWSQGVPTQCPELQPGHSTSARPEHFQTKPSAQIRGAHTKNYQVKTRSWPIMGWVLVFKGVRSDLRLAVIYFNQVQNATEWMDNVIN